MIKPEYLIANVMASLVAMVTHFNRKRRATLRRNREIVFRATIDSHGDERVTSREKLDFETRRILCEELPADLGKIYGIKATIRHIDSRQGSLVVFFGVMITTYGIIANYRDFLESIQLIREHAKFLLKTLDRIFQIQFGIDIEAYYSGLPKPHGIQYLAETILEASAAREGGLSKRDGFFWYLIIMNLILLIALGALVARAVVKMYF